MMNNNRSNLISLINGERQESKGMTKAEAIRFCYDWAMRDPEGFKDSYRKEQNLVVDRDTTISCRSHSEEEVERHYRDILRQGEELMREIEQKRSLNDQRSPQCP